MSRQLDMIRSRANGWPHAAALLLTLIITILPSASFAHILNVFAWVDKDEVVVEGKFNTGKKPVGGTVTVYDGYDKLLLTTELQKDGTVRLPLPDYESGLKVELVTSLGHESFWILTPHDIDSQRAKTQSEDAEDNKPTESQDEKGQLNTILDTTPDMSQGEKQNTSESKEGIQ